MSSRALDALFAEHADSQYTRDLLFSSVVDLMAVVVCQIQPTVHAACPAVAETLPVSITSVYNTRLGTVPDDAARDASQTDARLGSLRPVAKVQAPSTRSEEARAQENSLCEQDSRLDGPTTRRIEEKVTLKGLP
jgi:hypothetical protein